MIFLFYSSFFVSHLSNDSFYFYSKELNVSDCCLDKKACYKSEIVLLVFILLLYFISRLFTILVIVFFGGLDFSLLKDP